MFCMNYPEQSVKLAQRRQEIISILNDPIFREQFLLSRGKRDWEQCISFVSRNFPIIDKLIETVKEKGLNPLREENERLKKVTYDMEEWEVIWGTRLSCSPYKQTRLACNYPKLLVLLNRK